MWNPHYAAIRSAVAEIGETMAHFDRNDGPAVQLNPQGQADPRDGLKHAGLPTSMNKQVVLMRVLTDIGGLAENDRERVIRAVAEYYGFLR